MKSVKGLEAPQLNQSPPSRGAWIEMYFWAAWTGPA